MRITRTAEDPVRTRRTIALMMSGRGQTGRDITSSPHVRDDNVREVIQAFDERGFDHRSHTGQNTAIAGYVRRHDHRARPEVDFATGSPIRTWTGRPARAA